jgi:hypothetical protein
MIDPILFICVEQTHQVKPTQTSRPITHTNTKKHKLYPSAGECCSPPVGGGRQEHKRVQICGFMGG